MKMQLLKLMDGVGRNTNGYKLARLEMRRDSFWRKLYVMLPWFDYPKDNFESLSIFILKSSVDVLVHVTYFCLAYSYLEINAPSTLE